MIKTNRLSSLERDILHCIEIVGATDADDLSNILGESPRAVQDALIKLDDAGYVLMRNGIYRVSEAHKAGRL
jgi:predicted transcriptional regulator